MSKNCPFCRLTDEHLSWGTSEVGMLRDIHPVSPGHTLVIPRRHIASVFDATPSEYQALWAKVSSARDALAQEFGTHAFNIGVNDGLPAGQTVPHAHIHVIPRFEGDVPDPRGGIRWVIPERADYWSGR